MRKFKDGLIYNDKGKIVGAFEMGELKTAPPQDAAAEKERMAGGQSFGPGDVLTFTVNTGSGKLFVFNNGALISEVGYDACERSGQTLGTTFDFALPPGFKAWG